MNPILHSKIIGLTNTKPLCILHGFLGMSDNWKTLGAAFAAQGFQVHLIDQRNHGRSFHSTLFNYSTLAEDLKNYLDFHQVKKTAIIGHSMGGKIAMQFACTFPEKVSKLIVADIAPKNYPPHHHTILEALKTLDLAKIGSRNDADEALKTSLKNKGIRQFLLKNLYRTKLKQFDFRFNLAVLSEKMQEIGENIKAKDTFSGATLFIGGGNSDYIKAEDSIVILLHFPQASIFTIADAGHWLHAEQPDAFLNASLNFLD